MQINHQLFHTPEGKILSLGLLLFGLFVVLFLLYAIIDPTLIKGLFSITLTNIIFGRMAGLSIGISLEMPLPLLIIFNLLIESIMVLLLYPLFVLSWQKLDLISYAPLQNILNQSKKNAERYQPLIQRYGVIGLILFVLTPFAMTGPVVGSFVGFLIGFKHTKTLLIVLLSTLGAIIGWVYLIKNFEETLVRYNTLLMEGVLIATLLFMLWYLLRKMLKYLNT